ncbi:hypothetical protein BCR35DRAFT_356471 [Leucosporidium creatinivorum]|uniref:Peptidase C15, pyroglutamyl peptidase I-like protein n=1 Tax=Leucosporidium creatinivorum TaxID=106004 RepID=A0A1Y2C0K9_9BASI|nr:hypothetical protein BCR35DRAFT_356471 [Leucosporidium creatinivorum]
MAPTPHERPFRVHLTGFGPFRQYSENPSWLAVRQLEGITMKEAPPPLAALETPSEPQSPSPPAPLQPTIALSTSLIPVNYTDALELVPPLHDQDEPYDLIIHVGVGAPGGVVLERRARRWGYDKEGADGKLAESDGKRRGFVGEEWNVGEELQTRISREKVVEWVRRKGVEHLALSSDAGLYLCEFTFFCSLATAQRKASAKASAHPTPVQFIHVPPLKEPYNVEQLTSALKLLVWAIVNEGGLSDLLEQAT